MGRFTIRQLRLHCRIVAKATSIVHRKSLNRKYTDGKSQNKGYRQDGRCIRGTVDRVIHGRSGVRVQPEAGGRNPETTGLPAQYVCQCTGFEQKYTFACLLPLHEKGEYWTDVETGIHNAVETYSDFNVAVHLLL